MTFLFSKNYRIKSGLSRLGKREHRFYTVLSTVLFVIGSFALWEFAYELSNVGGSIVSGSPDVALKEIRRTFPMLLTALVLIYLGAYSLSAYRAKNAHSRTMLWRVNGIVTIVLGAVITGYIICGYVSGLYHAPIDGTLSLLFPLDLLITGIVFILYGLFSIIYASRKSGHTLLPFYNDTNRFGRRRKLWNPIYIFSYMAASCAFAASVTAIYVLDFSHGYIFFNITFWLMYILPWLMYVVYRYVYIELKPEYRIGAEKKLGILFLVVNVLVFALYMTAVQMYPEAPAQNAFGLMPIDFTASMNIFTVVYGLNNLLVPIAVLINYALRSGKRSK